MEEKLDRALESKAWHNSFLEARVVNDDAPPSDHFALILILGHKV